MAGFQTLHEKLCRELNLVKSDVTQVFMPLQCALIELC